MLEESLDFMQLRFLKFGEKHPMIKIFSSLKRKIFFSNLYLLRIYEADITWTLLLYTLI